MSIPIANPVISEAAKGAVSDVLDSGMLADGEVVREFEDRFAEFVGVDHAIATTNGTAALHAMLEAAGIGEGDTVLTSPFSFIASATAVRHAGADVAFADIDPETYNLDPKSVRRVLNHRSDITALMPVHLYGLPVEMGAFETIADEHGLQLFEDAAQAHGATYAGQGVGSIGDAAAFSFYPTKNMTTGEGGMITTDKDAVAKRARKVVNHGRSGRYEHSMIGYNFRMTNVEAAIGQEQLERLPGWVERRQENAARLNDALSGVDAIQTPVVPDNRTHAFHQYTVKTDERERLIEVLEPNDIGYGIYYPTTIPDEQAFDQLTAEIPTARMASETVLSLPVHPQIDSTDIDTITATVQEGLE